jgi:hypothetical protein
LCKNSKFKNQRSRLLRYARRHDCRQAVGLAKHCGQAKLQLKNQKFFRAVIFGF